MSNPYVSSIVTKYGDSDRVREDVKILNDIFRRQGASLLLGVIAENVGDAANRFNLNEENVKNIRESLVKELVEAIGERT